MKSNTKNLAKLTSLIGIVFGLMVFVLAARAEVPHETDSLYIGDGGTDDGGADDSVKRFNAKTGEFLGNFVPPLDSGGLNGPFVAPPGNGGLNGPRGLIFTQGKLYVVNQNVSTEDFPVDFAGEILRYRRSTGAFVDALVPCNPPLRVCDPNANAPFAPRGLIRGPGHTLYVASSIASKDVPSLPGSVRQFDARTGKFLRDLDTTGFNQPFFPRGLVRGPDDLVYVSVAGDLAPGDPPGSNPNFDPIPGYILRFNSHTGQFVDVFASNEGSGCAQHLHRPDGLVFGPDEKLYVTSFRADANDTDKVLIFERKTGKCLDKIDLDQVDKPRAFAQALLFGPKGRLFVPINNTGEVRRYNVKTKTFDIFVPSVANYGHLQQPWYLTFGETDPGTLEYDGD